MAACDQGLGGGVVVENRTDFELHFEIMLDSGPYTPVARVPPHEDATVITVSNLNGKRCLGSSVVAYTPDGTEVARTDEPLCFGDRWTIGADESPSARPSG